MGQKGDGVDDAAATVGAPEALAGFVGCDETIEKLYFYLDGELTEQRRIEITRHLDLCGPCVGAYGFESELRRLVASRAAPAGRRGAPRRERRRRLRPIRLPGPLEGQAYLHWTA
jgi:mycothiol system anti-sigma-R factor